MKRFIGLDVHKTVIEVCAIDEAGKTIWRRRMGCTREALLEFGKELNENDAIALEVTTNAWAVADILEPSVGKIVVSNPMKTKAIAEAKVKTDKVDALVLAQLLRCDYLPSVWIPDANTRVLRQLTSRRERLVSERTRIKNRVQSILAGLLIVVPVKTLFSKAGTKWLVDCGTPPAEQALIESDLLLIASVDQEINTLEKLLQKEAWKAPQVRLLMTIPGVDFCTALTLMAALGDLSRFTDGDHAASYLGLVPSIKQSANTCHYGSITKRGNTHARWMLTQSAQNIARHSGPLGVFFRRLAKRKNWNIAVCATARKLVTIAWLMLKNNEPYRYAHPTTTQHKLCRLRTAVTGENRLGERRGSPPGVKNGQTPTRKVVALSTVCQREGLPPAHGFEQLPIGEQRILKELGVIEYVKQISVDRSEPLKRTAVPNAISKKKTQKT